MVKNPHKGPLAQKLDELVASSGLSMFALAKLSGINRSQLTRIMSGETRQPTLDTLNALAKALAVDPEELYDAAWAEADGPLPSLPAYFRSKYRLTDDQIAAIERTVRRVEQQSAKNPIKKKS